MDIGCFAELERVYSTLLELGVRHSLRDCGIAKFRSEQMYPYTQRNIPFHGWLAWLRLSMLLVCAGISMHVLAAASGKPLIASGHILVGKKAASSEADFAASLGPDARSLGKLRGLEVHVVNVPPGNEEAAVTRLRGNPHVAFAEVDALREPDAMPDDPSLSSEWHLTKIEAPAAWDLAVGGGITIAILDTGVDGTHPDLAAHLVPGWNFYDNNANTGDVYGHGTSVAGTAAAAMNNGIGIAGVAGAASIMPVRISDPSGWAQLSTIAQGLTWAADHGARVANISYVVADSSTVISAANYFRSKGGVVASSAGNSGALSSTAATSSMFVVAATDASDAWASFSTYGPAVNIAAPGVGIYTTANGGGYRSASGTSFSSPIIAGAAALVLSRRPDYSPAQVDAVLKSTSVDLGMVGPDQYFGSGRVNLAAALTQAATSGTGDTTPPTVSITSPTGGTVTGTVTVSISATDNVGVTRVDLRVNGVTVATDATSPFQMTWNSASVANGSVQLTAAAYDAAGNLAVSAARTVTVSNTSSGDTTPPSVSIASLSPSSTLVSGTVAVVINATDNVGVSRVDLLVNGTIVGTSNTAPFQFSWDSTSIADGSATLSAKAYDAAGNSAISAGMVVTVANDKTAPSLEITSPAGGANLNGNVTITTSVSDNNGAAGITQRLYIDGVLKSSVTGKPLSVKWNARSSTVQSHTILVTASDVAGNSTSKQIQVTTGK